MKKMKKWAGGFMAVVLTAGMLSGCTGGSGKGSEQTNQPTQTGNTVTESTGTNGEKITIGWAMAYLITRSISC